LVIITVLSGLGRMDFGGKETNKIILVKILELIEEVKQ
jgi:hypothetical protein